MTPAQGRGRGWRREASDSTLVGFHGPCTNSLSLRDIPAVFR